MQSVRKPRPPKRPETLAELVLDLEERSPGDVEADVQLPAQEWLHLVAVASREDQAKAAELDAAKLGRPGGAALALLEGRAEAYGDASRRLAEALGWGALNDLDHLLQVVRGHVMALDCERERALDKLDKVRALVTRVCPLCGELGHVPEECGLAPSTPIDDEEEPALEVGTTIVERQRTKRKRAMAIKDVAP